MNLIVLLQTFFIVVAAYDSTNGYYGNWGEEIDTPWEGRTWNDINSRSLMDRWRRGASSDNSRFGINKLRNDVATIERNYFCYVYQLCNFKGYQFLTSVANESVVYFNSIKAVLNDKYGDKLSTPRDFVDDSTDRDAKKKKISTIMNLLADSWANLLGEFSKTEVARNTPDSFENFLDWFSDIVEMKNLDETVKRAEEVLELWPKQFHKQIATISPERVDKRSTFFETRNFRPFPGHFSQSRRHVNNHDQYHNRRFRRTSTEDIQSWYSKEGTVKEATTTMKEVFGYVFNCDPEMFTTEVDFLTKNGDQFKDTAVIAFKRILTDSYGALLKNKNIAQGEIVTKQRLAMDKNMKRLEDNIKNFWADQMELLSKENTHLYKEEASQWSSDFIPVYVRVVPYEQAREAYRRLEELEAETGKNNHDVDMAGKM